MKYRWSDERWAEMKAVVKAFLEERAENGDEETGVTDYTEVKDHLHEMLGEVLNFSNMQDVNAISGMLDEISRDTEEENGTVLSAIVLKRRGGRRIKMVGKGFWTMAVGCGKLDRRPQPHEQETVLSRLIAEVHRFYRGRGEAA